MATIEKDITQEQPVQQPEPQVQEPASALTSAWVMPKPYVWTRKKYEDAVERGLFGPEDRVELLEGMILEKMPQNSRHSTALTLTTDALRAIFPSGFLVRGQMPLVLDDLSEPEPDIAIVRGTARDYKDAQPTAQAAILVVEISDSTLATDRLIKSALYARALIPEYWIVNIEARVLEVYRQPGPADDPPIGFAYGEVLSFHETETITPLALSGTTVTVSEILP